MTIFLFRLYVVCYSVDLYSIEELVYYPAIKLFSEKTSHKRVWQQRSGVSILSALSILSDRNHWESVVSILIYGMDYFIHYVTYLT